MPVPQMAAETRRVILEVSVDWTKRKRQEAPESLNEKMVDKNDRLRVLDRQGVIESENRDSSFDTYSHTEHFLEK